MERFNLFSYLILTKAVSYFDLKNLWLIRRCVGAIQSEVFSVIHFLRFIVYRHKARRWHFSYENEKHVSYVEIDSDYGHDTFLIDSDETKQVIRCFLESV